MQLPSAISALVGNCEVEPVDIGESGVSVFRIARSRGRTVFLKCGPLGSELRAEAERLRWLSGRVPVPDVLVYLSEAGREYLLIDGLPGLNGIDAGRRDPLSVAAALGRALKHFHVQAARDCPFDQTIDVQMRRARWRTENGLVDLADFDQERLGRSAFELLAELEASRPATEERVVTHGDACLPNVIFEGGRVTGFVDCGRAGIADPYQDLALASRSIEWNLGVGCADMFFRQYGVSNPDPAKLDFYRLLDEFF